LPDNISLLPEEVEREIEYTNHIRVFPPIAGKEFANHLEELGYIEISSSAWMKSPSTETATLYLERMTVLLDIAPFAGNVPGLQILDPTRPVKYYRGRWNEPDGYSGQFVGRRAQAYGADLWCYVEVREGRPIKLLDLPLKNSIWRGCDEAWRIQAAIDYVRGTPQVFRIRPGPIGTSVIDFFSPLPMWVLRKIEVTGEPVPYSGCLFSYKLRENELSEEIQFLKEHIWLAEET
jgi:hypothetical protein